MSEIKWCLERARKRADESLEREAVILGGVVTILEGIAERYEQTIASKVEAELVSYDNRVRHLEAELADAQKELAAARGRNLVLAGQLAELRRSEE